MPAPSAPSVSLDHPTYVNGATATLTVTYSDSNTKAWTITVILSDPGTGDTSAPATATAVIDPSSLTVTDSLGHTWTKVSDSGSVAVYTTTV